MTVNYATTTGIGINIDPSTNSPTTDAKFALGTRALGTNGTEWIYVRAGAAITIYDYVCIDSAFSATSGTKTNVDKGFGIGFAQNAFASLEYGWVATRGIGIRVNALTLCVADVALYTSATTGAVDDLPTSQTQLRGVTLNTTVGGATAATALKAFSNVFAV